MAEVDQVMLNFSPTSLAVLNGILAIVMLGVALDLTLGDFRRLLDAPRALLLGFFSQFIFLPAATFLLVFLLRPSASIALGMMLVAACPGGNISNFITHRAGGNTALSVSLTAVATVCATIMTPFNLAFWGSLYAPALPLLTETSVSPFQMAWTVAVLLVFPLVLGMIINSRFPAVAARMRGPMRIVSMIIFAAFVIGALAANWQYFLEYVGLVAGLVLLHNAVALGGGYGIAWLGGLDEYDRRAVSIETGIQNSGLGLILIFNFFGGLGGMAIVAAWWGVWHILSGFALAAWFNRRPARASGATA
ncbi:MAG: bile acid:sodium symporter family protein [Rhizobiaceae bacterium]